MLSQTVKKDSTTLSNIKKNEQQKSNKIVKNLSECFGCLFLLIVYHMAAWFNQSIAEAICHSVTPGEPWTRRGSAGVGQTAMSTLLFFVLKLFCS